MSAETNGMGMILPVWCTHISRAPSVPLTPSVCGWAVDSLRRSWCKLHMTCRFVNEYEEYKAASEEIAEKLRTEVQLLYEYTEKLTHIMERIECGMCARATKTNR